MSCAEIMFFELFLFPRDIVAQYLNLRKSLDHLGGAKTDTVDVDKD